MSRWRARRRIVSRNSNGGGWRIWTIYSPLLLQGPPLRNPSIWLLASYLSRIVNTLYPFVLASLSNIISPTIHPLIAPYQFSSRGKTNILSFVIYRMKTRLSSRLITTNDDLILLKKRLVILFKGLTSLKKYSLIRNLEKFRHGVSHFSSLLRQFVAPKQWRNEIEKKRRRNSSFAHNLTLLSNDLFPPSAKYFILILQDSHRVNANDQGKW